MAVPACILCGVRPAAYLFVTPICSGCARVSMLSIEPRGSGSVMILRRPGDTRQVVVSTNERGVDAPEWASRTKARMSRLREIERDRAETDDPAFLKIFGAYVSRHGHTPLAVETIERQRAKGVFLDQVRAASGYEEDVA